ncbi:MCE family protein [Rugosimonospora africana]|uniref:ABC transporter substrate-binding protein n=1 Tax=Rugosimonospora africana TaxID=556532 RepID=A0A8J3QWI4_9ACTN|nr:MCE family protein [Rugosimonospora africana]GIH18424.1 ABC transporter substrate-binding protein [Rugosimonospora africana]
MRRFLRNPAVIGVLGLILLAGIVVLALNADNLPVIGGGTAYTADFTEAAGLKPGNEVRVAGVKVGKVTEVSLAGAHVKVRFRVKHTWIGDASTVAIKIKTLLGDKYLAVNPLGDDDQRPARVIPLGRTTSPLDVTEAFDQLSSTIGQIDTSTLAQGFEAIAQTFRDTPPEMRSMLQGLSSLSQTISSRDAQLAQLLAATKQVTGQLSGENSQFQALLRDGNLLLAEIQSRRDAIGALLSGTQQLATQISGLVADNTAQLGPTLTALDTVTSVLQRNQDNLTKALALAGPYYRLVGNTVGNGRWFDSYLCGLVPNSYLPPGAGPPTGCIPPKPGSGK